MAWAAAVLAPLLAVGLLVAPGLLGDAADPPGSEHEVPLILAWTVTAFPCPPGHDNGHEDDDLCLGYEGGLPGPTLVVEQGTTVELTVRNAIAASLDDLPPGTPIPDGLVQAAVSFHVHGMVLSVADDGLAPVPGTSIPDSSIAPGASRTYTFMATYPGVWHYHDHVMGPDGAHGQVRGLYGAIHVLDRGAAPEQVIDLHVLDTGAHGGLGVDATAAAGEPFTIAAIGLGNFWWTVTLTDPAGALVDTVALGPGVSLALRVPAAAPGTYTWEATSPLVRGAATGTVVVT